MAEDIFDVIVVGGGIAGNTAAYLLAKEGLGVLLVERGKTNGSKNMTGGRLYTHSLKKIFPYVSQQAPLERKIVREKYTYRNGEEMETLELGEDVFCVPGESYAVLRAGFDAWMGECAENEGAMCVTGVRVDDLLMREGKVCGIIAGGEEMEARVVILADGVNSLLAQKAGLKQELVPEQTEVGAKEVWALDPALIEERFGVKPGEGLQWMFEGKACFGHEGTGFLYTNQESISIGILTALDTLTSDGMAVTEMIDCFKENPLIAPLLEGAKLLEYSAHLLPKGNSEGLSALYGDGVLVIGDAAGMVINRGYVVRGMDLAVESAWLAAETIKKASEQDDFSGKVLQSYESAVKESFIINEMDDREPYHKELGAIFH